MYVEFLVSSTIGLAPSLRLSRKRMLLSHVSFCRKVISVVGFQFICGTGMIKTARVKCLLLVREVGLYGSVAS